MSRRVRVGVDMHVFDGKFQGSRSHLLGVYGEMTRLCPEFDFVFMLEQADALAKVDGFQGANVAFARMPHANPLKRLVWQLPQLRRQLKLDLLHTQYVIPLWPGRANAVTIHDVLFEEYPQYFGRLFTMRSRILMRWAARKAELVFTVSAYSRKAIASHYGCAEERIEVTHNAVDTRVFFPGKAGLEEVLARGLQSGGYLLTVGRIEPRKNHAELLRAYRALPGTPPPLVIVGQRDFGFADFEHEMAQMPAGRKVMIFSDVEDGELPALYRHAMLFVYPSFAEGFGMPPLEAMASGVAVVTSMSTAIPEVVGDAGLLVDPAKPGALAHALQSLIDNTTHREALAVHGLERAKAFTWAASARTLAAAYRRHFGILK